MHAIADTVDGGVRSSLLWPRPSPAWRRAERPAGDERSPGSACWGEPIALDGSGRAVALPADRAPAMPVALRSAHHGFVAQGQPEARDAADRLVVIQWMIAGAGALDEGAGRGEPFAPGTVGIHLPASPRAFRFSAAVSEVCGFSLEGPLAEQFVLELGLAAGVHPFGAAPVERVRALMERAACRTREGRRRASLAAIELLYEIASVVRVPEPQSVVSRARQMIEQGCSDPDLSASSLAAALGYHRGSLSQLFHKQTGVTLIHYITRVRLREATGLLRHTDRKVADVARRCGFRDARYFCRWFRRQTGSLPTELRRSLRSCDPVEVET